MKKTPNTPTLYYYLTILLLTSIIGLITVKFLANPLAGDGPKYNEAALSLVNSNTYPIVGDILLPPGLPFFLALVFKIFGQNYNIFYFCQFILLSGISYAVFLISYKFLKLSRLQSFLPALIIVFWPYFSVYANQIMTEILFTFLLTWSIYFLLKFWQNPNTKNIIILGAISGLSALTRPTSLLLLFWLFGFFIFILLIKKKPIIKNNYFKKIIFVIAIYILTILPWTVFATSKTGVFTPVTSTLTEIYNDDNKTYIYEWAHYKTPGYEPEAKVTASKIISIKLKNIYRFWESGANGTQAEDVIKNHPKANILIIAYKIEFYILLALFFLSIRFYRKTNITILWLVILYSWALHVVLHPYPRYTLPIIPLMIILAFYSFYNIKQKTCRQKK
ncbi:glycosyltransferase family 39 protein [Candidatus Parcubacteria bacterium]|nr:glycosyltransferase family 39 protein [Candidatus Parcubacteria bacterium]